MHSRTTAPRRAAAILRVAAMLAAVPPLAAQQPHRMHPAARDTMSGDAMGAMGVFGISMDRMGSGTTWIPDAVALPARHLERGSWSLMLHGFAFLEYDAQGGPRGATQLGSLNWTMGMASRSLAGGRIQARVMLSLDPATVTNQGYPLLLQTGESYKGQPLHDRQHPHDFWMELAVLYERPISRHLAVSLYVAPSGEPALGPVAFMHRPSAMDNPVAPLSHHWQDATHISFGVLTAGVFTRHWKLETSVFNGREPNEERWGFDPLRLDSWSARLTVNPDSFWSLTAGYGYLKSPEASSPLEPTRRFTASAMHGRRLRDGGQWTTTLIWGANRREGRTSHGVLLESEAVFGRNTVLARAELVEKNAGEVVLPGGAGGFAPDSALTIGSVSAGYIREFLHLPGASIGAGVLGTVNVVPASLESAYGSRTPVGGMVFLRLRPLHSLHQAGMNGMTMSRVP